jgi:hypothetical protein
MEKQLEDHLVIRKPLINQILNCHDQQRQATDQLITHLRQMIHDRSCLSFGDEQKEAGRQLRQLERAFELYKQAEAKIQIIITRLGGGN